MHAVCLLKKLVGSSQSLPAAQFEVPSEGGLDPELYSIDPPVGNFSRLRQYGTVSDAS